MELYNLSPAAGSTKEAFRKGRGHGSGNGPSQIARILKKEQVLTPTMYAYTRYGMNHTCLDTAHLYNWSDSAIANLLENEIYLGNTVNMKYSTLSSYSFLKMASSSAFCFRMAASSFSCLRISRWISADCLLPI